MSDFEHIIFPWIFNLRLRADVKGVLNEHMTVADQLLDELNEIYADRADCAVLVDAINHSENIRKKLTRLLEVEGDLQRHMEEALRLQESSNRRKSLRMKVRKRIEEDEDNIPLADARFVQE